MIGLETCERKLEDTSIICSRSPPYIQLLHTTDIFPPRISLPTFFPAMGLDSSVQSVVATILFLASLKLSYVSVRE